MQKLNHELLINEVLEHRKEDCAHYETCLSEASLLLWPSFSCKNCPNFCNGGVNIMSYERACNPLAWEA